MNKSVRVTGQNGQVVNISPNNPKYGYIRVEQTVMSMDNGWMRKKTVSALVPGEVADLKGLALSHGDELPGRIQVKEQLEAFNPENPEKDLKIAGDTGITCTIAGEPIYRKTFYSEDGEADVKLAHDNGDAISAKYQELKAAETTDADLAE